jgi:ATP-dependent RNA helicase DDX23/PRP28
MLNVLSRALKKAMEQKERKKAWEDRHWTDKPLDAMTDRDWRILKSDFEISSKGDIHHLLLH